MKHLLLLIVGIFALIFSANAQVYINVQSAVPEEETSWFILYLDEEPQDAFHYPEMEVEDLLPGKYELRLAFNADTIADVSKTVKVQRGDSLYFKVVHLKELKKEARKAGRGFGRLFDKDKSVREKETLKEVYRLEEAEPEE
jgi:hypothetical protein